MEGLDSDILFVTDYKRLRPKVTRLAIRYVRDPMAAEDIVSDSFAAFLKIFKTIRGDMNRDAYLMSIVKNNCLNYLYAKQNHLRIEKDIHDTGARMIEENIRSLKLCDPMRLFENEVHSITVTTLSKMSELERRVFEKSRFEGKTYAEIAEECGITVRKVTSIMQKVLAKLRLSLKDYIK